MIKVLRVLNIKNLAKSGPESLQLAYGKKNIALERVVRLSLML